MASPSTTLTSQRSDIGMAFEEFDLEANRVGFVAPTVLPYFDVRKQSDVFGKIPVEELLSIKNTVRAGNSGYSRSNFQFTEDSYRTQEHGHEVPVDARDQSIYAELIDAEIVSARRARHIVLQNQEVACASLIQDDSVFNDTGVSVSWLTTDTAVPLTDVKNAVSRLRAKGIVANALILTHAQYVALQFCDSILEKVASFGAGSSILPGNINKEALAKAFDLPHIVIAGAIKNSADDGLAASLGSIWDDSMATVGRIPESNDISEPCIGRTFHYTEDGSLPGTLIESYWEDKVRATIIRARHDIHQKLIYPEAGELLTAVLGA